MLMEFKEGDRVHVTRYHREDVDFYGTISEESSPHYYFLEKCSGDITELPIILLKPSNLFFGTDKTDYYVLAEDEEDTEEPVIQHTTDNVNHPDHYNYGEIEIIDFIDQVSEHYNPVVAVHIANAIKYLSRAPHKNGKEDIEKARWYIERAYQKWSD